MNLLEIPVQEVSADGQDVAAAAVVLLHRHRLRQARARHRRAAAGGEREEGGNRKGREIKIISNMIGENEDMEYVISSEQSSVIVLGLGWISALASVQTCED